MLAFLVRAVLLAALAQGAFSSDPASSELWRWWQVTGRAGSVDVAYLPHLNGGGTSFGMDLVRFAYNTVGFSYGRCFEFCSGPAFIGFALLAFGVCDELVLADVNPLAVEGLRRTRSDPRNAHVRDRIFIYESDGLDGIPASERWDLVIGNPPHMADGASLRTLDAGWNLHRRFYSKILDHLTESGVVILQENGAASQVSTFYDMIVDGGLRLVAAESSHQPATRRMLYLVSKPREGPRTYEQHWAAPTEAPLRRAEWLPCDRAEREGREDGLNDNASHQPFYVSLAMVIDGSETVFDYLWESDDAALASAAKAHLLSHGVASDAAVGQIAAATTNARAARASVPRRRASASGEACSGLLLRTSNLFEEEPSLRSMESFGWCLGFERIAEPTPYINEGAIGDCFPKASAA